MPHHHRRGGAAPGAKWRRYGQDHPPTNASAPGYDRNNPGNASVFNPTISYNQATPPFPSFNPPYDPTQSPAYAAALPYQGPGGYTGYGQSWVHPMEAPHSFPTSFAAPFGAPFHPTPPALAPEPFAPSGPRSEHWRRADPDEQPRQRWRGENGHGAAQPYSRRVERPPAPREYENRGGWRPPSTRQNLPTDRRRDPSTADRRRDGSRSRSPEPHADAVAPPPPAAYGPDGSYIPPVRRQRKDVRTAPLVPPTATYLAATLEPSETTSRDDEPAEPLYLILDLNHTLLVRSRRDQVASRIPVVRPYLSTFLTYICSREHGSSPEDGAPVKPPRFEPIVYSSARAPNVLRMLAAVSLVPPERAESYIAGLRGIPPPYKPRPDQGDVLKMVFTRSMMGLSNADYHGDIETVKDLGRVWQLLDFGREVQQAEEQRMRGDQTATENQGRKGHQSDSIVEESGEPRSSGEAADHAAEPAAGSATFGTGQPSQSRALPPARINKKAKARIAHVRDEHGARRTLLLDDEASKVAQQPYSHLPIPPFLVHPEHFPSGSSGSASNASNPSTALSLDPAHPPAQDRALLVSIAQLERARRESNLAAWVRSGGLDVMREEVRDALRAGLEEAEITEARVDEELAKRGEEVCRHYGIEVRRDWDPEWRLKLLEKEGRLVSPKA